MKILISGSHGLVGTALIQALESEGHDIFRLVRYAPHSETEIEWSPDRYSIALARLEGFDAVVHLAGESIAEGRWSDEKKKQIRESRVKGTRLLGDALANFECETTTMHDGGDHVIFVGRVLALRTGEGRPLLYYRGAYRQIVESS